MITAASHQHQYPHPHQETHQDKPSLKQIVIQHKQSVIQIASYLTIGTVTLVAASSLFCLFLAVTLVDDFIKALFSSSKLLLLNNKVIDWTGWIDNISHQLSNFAEWEKQKRTSWYSEDNPIYHQDRFHDLIYAVTTYMNEYVVSHRSQQQQQQQQNKSFK